MFGLSAPVLGMDLGTCNTLIYLKDKGQDGIVLNEPSVIAVERGTNKVVAVGKEAKRMLWRTPGSIVATRPMRDGVIADLDCCEMMMGHFINMVMPRFRFSKPRLVIGVPTCITEVEKRAVEEGAFKAGARDVTIIEESKAAAIGADIPINDPEGHLVCDIGGGTTEVSVLSLGDIVVTKAVRVAGDEFDSAIVNYIRGEMNLKIGEQSAEDVKITIGTAMPDREVKKMEISGTDTVTGLPKRVEVDSLRIRDALHSTVEQIAAVIKDTLSQTPPELSADIVTSGIMMTGGGSLLRGLPQYLSKEIGIPVNLADEPLLCVALGAGKYYEVVGRAAVQASGFYTNLSNN